MFEIQPYVQTIEDADADLVMPSEPLHVWSCGKGAFWQ